MNSACYRHYDHEDRMSYLESLIGPNMDAMERWRADITVQELDDTLWELARSWVESWAPCEEEE